MWDGGRSIYELELKHKGWRSYKAGNNAFDRRKAIWATIEKLMSKDGGELTEQGAVELVQKRLDDLGGNSQSPSITDFNSQLKTDEFDGDKFELEVHKERREQRANKRRRTNVEDV